MADPQNSDTSTGITGKPASPTPQQTNTRRRLTAILLGVGALILLTGASAGWLGVKASIIQDELGAATYLVTPLREQIATDNAAEAVSTVDQIRAHTAAAKTAAGDPLWTLASSMPWVGPNFAAVADVAQSADDVANLGLTPLVSVYESLDWNKLLPNAGGTNFDALKAASPKVNSASHAVGASAERLDQIDVNDLLPQVAEPLRQARDQLHGVTGALNAAADASKIAPQMLGADTPRVYLLMIQNNAESRASGGIPGALAVLTVDKGRLSLTAQSSAGEVGVMSPKLPIDPSQEQIYSGRLGKFMQDVNLTPDFPSAAAMAAAMWERKNGQVVDGVLSIDPVALSYILEATGPVAVTNSDLRVIAGTGLPMELTSSNVVQVLLSDVYAKIQPTRLQDLYFAGVAQQIFATLSEGNSDAKALLGALGRGAEESRVLVWSAAPQEQSIITRYPISGSIAGPSVSPAGFGVYFNDGTGAKMDYYVRRTVQLVKECAKEGYEQMTVRITSTNTAPVDAATSLPAYVTGDGNFGVPPGSVQTNIVAYGPAQANVETARQDGQRTEFAPYFHSNRPVGIHAVQLAPGETKVVEFTFGKIVQHTEPHVVVTPTVQHVKDVTLPTEILSCS